jgi:predicted transcriptional regulator
MIYLIVCEENKTCKIGFSNLPEKRLSQLQTGNPNYLRLATVIQGSFKDEKILHEKFKKFKINGEWFSYSKEIKEYFGIEDFIPVFFNFWIIIMEKDLSKSDIELLSYLMFNYSDNVPFNISNYVKEQVSIRTGKSKTSYNNSTRKLLESGLIYKVSCNSYKINPEYAFKGSSADRKKLVIELKSN